MQQRTIGDRPGQRDRARRHADVDRGPPGRGPLDRDDPRRARRRRHPDRHRRRLPPRRRRGRAQRGADRRGAARRAAATPPTCWSRPRAATCGPATARGPSTARPSTCKQAACEASLKRLGVEAIGLYQFHRPDPAVPYAESVGALARPARRRQDPDGAGISNADPDQIREAQEVLGGRLVSVQNQFSPAFRSQPSPSCGCAPSWASPSCRGARSAASRSAADLGGAPRGVRRGRRRRTA